MKNRNPSPCSNNNEDVNEPREGIRKKQMSKKSRCTKAAARENIMSYTSREERRLDPDST